MRKYIYYAPLITVCLLVTACKPSLPKEARQALDDGLRGQTSATYTVTSAEEASKPYINNTNYDEVWCITIDTEIDIGMPISHFYVGREGRLWSEHTEPFKEGFLKHGCESW